MIDNRVDDYKTYPFERKVLSNGIEVILVKQDELPSLSFDFMLKMGSKQDPQNKEGLLGLLAETIDKGTNYHSASQIAEKLDLLGTYFIYDLNSDSIFFSLETLSWLDESALKILSEIITQPAFLEEEFNRAKLKVTGLVQRSAEQFSAYSSKLFNKYLYEFHPYGFYRSGNLKSLKNIQLVDIKEFYNRYFNPQDVVISVAGRYSEDIIQKLEKSFGSWKKEKAQGLEGNDIDVSLVPSTEEMEILLVDHPSAIQSEIRMGHISVSRSHPDYLALSLANVILGGSFNSRLMSHIRVKKGLTYGVSSSISSKKELGAFKLGLAVRNDKVGEAVKEIQKVLVEFCEKGITSAELKKAVHLMKNSFITGTAIADNFAGYLLYLNSLGVSYDFVSQYFDQINALSVEAVNQAIKKNLNPKKIKILILSNVSQIEEQLKDFDKVAVKNYKEFL